MAISPPSDIVLDVARAVEPAGVAGGARRAGEAGRQRHAQSQRSRVDARRRRSSATVAARPTATTSTETFKRFEAMVLQTFIQNMLPKDAESVYGKGMAGDMWKSMMAERIADVMAERGGIGIADRMLGDHYMDGKRKVAVGPVSGGPGKAETRPADHACRRRWSRNCSARWPTLARTRRADASAQHLTSTGSDVMTDYSESTSEPAGTHEPQPTPHSAGRPGNLGAIIGRIEEAVDEETAAIRTDTSFDIKASNARKSRYLYELTRAIKGIGEAEILAEHREGLDRLRDKLASNEAAILAHLNAVSEVATLHAGRHPARGGRRHLFGRRVRVGT